MQTTARLTPLGDRRQRDKCLMLTPWPVSLLSGRDGGDTSQFTCDQREERRPQHDPLCPRPLPPAAQLPLSVRRGEERPLQIRLAHPPHTLRHGRRLGNHQLTLSTRHQGTKEGEGAGRMYFKV